MRIINIAQKPLEDKVPIVLDILSRAGKSLDSFKYFSSRPMTILANHIVTLIGYENGTPVAYGHLDHDEKNTWLGIFVIESAQGRGLGKRIFKRLSKEARKKNLVISLAVFQTNTRAIRMYEKAGFRLKKQDETRRWYQKDFSNKDRQ